jgi:uncharacterized protein with von Willebrand factor type A (vWA) domain
MADIPEEQIQEAYRRYCAHRDSETKYRRMDVIMSVAVALVIVAFVVASYFTVRANFSQERLSVRLSSEISAMTPQISDALLAVGEEVMPLYLEQGEKKLRDALPRLELALSEELEKLWGGMHAQIEADFDAALDRSGKKLEQRLQQQFPELLEAPNLALLEKELNEMLEKDTSEFLGRFFDQYSKDLNGMYKTIDGFRPSRFERLSNEELAAQYMHLWLTLLDREILGLE